MRHGNPFYEQFEEYQQLEKSKSNSSEDLEEHIEKLMKDSRELYWLIFEKVQKGDLGEFNKDYLGVLEVAVRYLELSYRDLNKQKTNNKQSFLNKTLHIYYQPLRKVGNRMKTFWSGFPIVEFQEIKKAWINFTEVTTPKLFFTFLGTIFTLLFGKFNFLIYTYIILTIAHFLARWWANKYRDNDNYISFVKNLQLFLFSYLTLAIGRALSSFINPDGLPEGTFYALYLLLAIWAELKGFVENAKIAKLPIHPMLEKLVNSRRGNNNIEPPF